MNVDYGTWDILVMIKSLINLSQTYEFFSFQFFFIILTMSPMLFFTRSHIQVVYRGARKGRGLVVAPKDYSTKYRY